MAGSGRELVPWQLSALVPAGRSALPAAPPGGPARGADLHRNRAPRDRRRAVRLPDGLLRGLLVDLRA